MREKNKAYKIYNPKTQGHLDFLVNVEILRNQDAIVRKAGKHMQGLLYSCYTSLYFLWTGNQDSEVLNGLFKSTQLLFGHTSVNPVPESSSPSTVNILADSFTCVSFLSPAGMSSSSEQAEDFCA